MISESVISCRITCPSGVSYTRSAPIEITVPSTCTGISLNWKRLVAGSSASNRAKRSSMVLPLLISLAADSRRFARPVRSAVSYEHRAHAATVFIAPDRRVDPGPLRAAGCVRVDWRDPLRPELARKDRRSPDAGPQTVGLTTP